MSHESNEHFETRVTALELQTRRMISDRESDKTNHAEIHTRLWGAVEQLQRSVYGGDIALGLNARMDAQEKTVSEIKKIVKDLQKTAWVMLGGFAVIKFLFDVIIK